METILEVLEEIAPLRLSETWDNTGLLVKADKSGESPLRILLTIDLTPEVVEEAIRTKIHLVVTYHPVLFNPVKSLKGPEAEKLVACIQNGISIYSPHTALDNVSPGMSDWIANFFPWAKIWPLLPNNEGSDDGSGRVVVLKEPHSFEEVLELVSSGFSTPYLRIAEPATPHSIRKIVVCPGAGASMFQSLGADIDCVVTGELPHHSILALAQKGRYAIFCEHDRSERGFLPHLKTHLEDKLFQRELKNVSVSISKEDRCPVQLRLFDSLLK